MFAVSSKEALRRGCAFLCVLAIGTLLASKAGAQDDPLHIWVGKQDAPSAEKWVNTHIAQSKKDIDEVLAVKGKRTVENTFRPFDNAQNELGLAAAEAYLMYGVAPQKEVRDVGQSLAQTVSRVLNDISLNQEVYRALTAVDVSSADPATKHYMERTLLEYRLAGVDKNEATRAEIKKKLDHITETALKFGRNVQENVNRVVVKDKSELAGLPDDFIAGHAPAADGTITLTTDETDEDPVINYAANESLRKRMYLAYNTRAYPANKEILLDVLKTRYDLAKMLGYSNWADFATADQMMGSAANMKSFLDSVDQGVPKSGGARVRDAIDVCESKAAGLG